MFRLSKITTSNFRSKLSRKLFSQVYSSIVKLPDNVNSNEIKIPLYGENYTIYFKDNDSLAEIQQKLKQTDDKLAKLEFLDINEQTITDENKLFKDVIQNPFQLKINNYMNIKYFPSLNMVINADKKAVSSDNDKDYYILNSYNYFLFNALAKTAANSLSDISSYKSEVEGRLNSLLNIYEQLLKEYSKAEEILENKYNKIKNNLILMGILFFIIHAIVFYVLIYHIYGWDTIEPYTYIVGNIYWIIGLLFFVSKKKKLDVSFFNSEGFKKDFFLKHGKNLGFNQLDKKFVTEEIRKINQLKETITKI